MKAKTDVQNKGNFLKGFLVGLLFIMSFLNVHVAVQRNTNDSILGLFSLEMATVAAQGKDQDGEGKEGKNLDNGRPLKSNGSAYCCENSGNDCAAACC